MNDIIKIIIDCECKDLEEFIDLSPIENKQLLGLSNTYEDGEWRYSEFQDYLWDNISQAALTHKERESLLRKPGTLLKKSAKNLNLKKDGGEIGEILLYAIMKDYYKAISVVPKIFYKQNPNDPVKQADSVHIVIEGKNQFSLWLGEAKFFNSIEDNRFSEVVKSVSQTMVTDKLRKENRIITNIQELDYIEIDENVKNKIRETLSEGNSIDNIKPLLHIPILLLHEYEVLKKFKQFNEEFKESIKKYILERAHSYFQKQINKCKSVNMYSSIHFHLIIFPVPNKEQILSDFMRKANAFRN